MPQTENINGPQLGIHLHRDQPNFTLPDTVTGHVFRSTHLVTSNAVITITLVGGSKSRMVVRHGSWGRTYRGRFALVNESEHTQKLLEAPLHIPEDGEGSTWPFAISLPTHFDAVKTAAGTTQDDCYLALGPDAPRTYRLPPSFDEQKWGYGEGMGCFVEYFLRAELVTTSRGSTNTTEATQPLTITTLNHDSPRRNVRWATSQHADSRKRSEVVTDPSAVQASSSTENEKRLSPSLDFAIVIQTPAVLQLDQSDPISLLLLAEPRTSLDSDMALLLSQEILVTEIVVDLVASTSIKCHGRRGSRNANTESKFSLSKKESCQNIAALKIPWSKNSNSRKDSSHDTHDTPSSYDSSQMLDADVRLGLRLPTEGVSETFTTHNIRHTYRLEWKVTIQIANRTSSFSGAAPVEVVAPSSDNVPVEYEHLEDEDMVERSRSVDAEGMPPEYSSEQPLPPRPPRNPGGAYGLSRLWEGM